jgi:nucleoside-diphosphate-sugar epimerase
LNFGYWGEIYNVGTGQPTKFIELFDYIKKLTNSKSEFISIDPPAFHKFVQSKDNYLNIMKLISTGFRPKLNVYEGIKTIL